MIFHKQSLLSSVLFGIATVIIYATAIDYGDEFKLGVSFFTSCGAVGLTLVGIIVHGIGAKNSEWTWSWMTETVLSAYFSLATDLT